MSEPRFTTINLNSTSEGGVLLTFAGGTAGIAYLELSRGDVVQLVEKLHRMSDWSRPAE